MGMESDTEVAASLDDRLFRGEGQVNSQVIDVSAREFLRPNEGSIKACSTAGLLRDICCPCNKQ